MTCVIICFIPSRSQLTGKAQRESVEIFSENLKRLLLASPIKGTVVLGIDPGFKHGCKLAVLDANGRCARSFSGLVPRSHIQRGLFAPIFILGTISVRCNTRDMKSMSLILFLFLQ